LADCLSSEDWIVLPPLLDVLSSGNISNRRLYSYSRESVINNGVLAGKLEYLSDSYIGPCINSAWSKLDKYYGLTEIFGIYCDYGANTVPKMDLD
jgi:hypothetical protein